MSPTDPGRPSLPDTQLDSRPKTSVPAWLRAWWPAILWAVLISVLSTDTFSSEHTSRIIEPILRWLFPAIPMDTLDFVHHLIRKSAHFVEYFIFFVLLYHGFRAMKRDSTPWHWSWALVAWLIAAVYSVLDEVHQIFVPSRGPSPWDSLLDSTGALVALFVLFLLYRRYLRTRTD
jgi:VanZ family protein